MKVIFTEIAVKEFYQAKFFYEQEVKGLGIEFSKELRNSLKRIIKFPEAWPILKNDIRKCIIRKFPYILLFSIEKNFILIISVAHQHRKPFYWVEE